MIHAIIMPPEKYSVDINGYNVGLYESYWADQHLFCIMSRMCSAFFMYEGDCGGIPNGRKIVQIDSESLYKATLSQSIGGVAVTTLLEDTDPREWCDLFRTSDVDHLAICEMFKNDQFKPKDAMWMSAYARTLQYEKFYRGKVAKKGNTVVTAFASRISQEEDVFLEKTKESLYKIFREKLNVGKVS